MNKTIGLYAAVITAILAWWYLAFKPVEPLFDSPYLTPRATTHAPFPKPEHLSHLSPMDRDLIQRALGGDSKLMTSLIVEWDIDAQIMEKNGLFGVKRLERQSFLQAQILGRKIFESPNRTPPQALHITDDRGTPLKTNSDYNCFLPQTYAAASFLLALNDPHQIAAIPQGIRNDPGLYPEELTKRIPYNIDRYQSEKIFQEKPDIAFVAHYSHPATLQTLQNQGIQLFMLKGELNTIYDISHALQRIGKLVNRPEKSELLTLFMESAMIAIDNRMLALHASLDKAHPTKVMFLHYFTHFSHPTAKTITGKLMQRLQPYNFCFMPDSLANERQWLMPVDQEKILDYNPDCLIIATSNEDAMDEEIRRHPTLQCVPAVKNGKVYFVDSSIQQSPTQYLILAYYDLANALAHHQ